MANKKEIFNLSARRAQAAQANEANKKVTPVQLDDETTVHFKPQGLWKINAVEQLEKGKFNDFIKSTLSEEDYQKISGFDLTFDEFSDLLEYVNEQNLPEEGK
ncbi:hypothetical protein ACFYOC_24125 [Nocardiopsis alba]|uniref:hypothetical protein n=1 Tax=Nocardiopsis alba TaxID=53437 RepID=UPI0033A82241